MRVNVSLFGCACFFWGLTASSAFLLPVRSGNAFGGRVMGVSRQARVMMATAFFQEDPALKEMQAQLMADLKTAGQEGNTAKAMDILKTLESKDIEKNVVMYNRALKACVVAKDYGKLKELAKTMKESMVGMDDVTVKLLVDMHIAQGDLAAAVGVWEEARETDALHAIDASLYDMAIGAYRKQGAFDKALDLCDEMRALRLNPTKEGYAFIATMAIRDKKTYLISRTLDTMKQEGFSAEDVEYVRAVILEELPDNLKHQAEGEVVSAPKA